MLLDQPLPEAFPRRQHDGLRALYRTAGHYHAQLDSFQIDSTGTLSLWIQPGPVMRLGAVRFYGSSSEWPGLMRELWSLHSGMPFREAQVHRQMERLTEALAEKSHPLALLTLDSLSIVDGPVPSVELDISVDAGKRVNLASVRVTGQRVTQQSFILRESRLKPGQAYRPSALRQAADALNRLGYFKPVGLPRVVFDGNGAHVYIVVEESNTYRFDGILGYVPAANTRESGYVTGQLEFGLRNLLGTGRDFYAQWQKKDRFSQHMDLRYREPWIGGIPLFAMGEFAQEIRDSTYVRREGRLSLGYAYQGQWEAGVTLTMDTVLPDSIEARRLGIPKSQSRGISGFLSYSSFNDPLNPRTGLFLNAALAYGLKRHLAYRTEHMDREESVRTLSLDLRFVQPISGRHVFFLGVSGNEIKADHIDAGHLIRLGGTKTVRGYAEDAFSGHRAVWMNMEYRMLTGPRSRLFFFLDGMQMESNNTVGDVEKMIRWGYGFGVRINTRLGVMGVDYGLGQGDGWMNGKVHVGLINHF